MLRIIIKRQEFLEYSTNYTTIEVVEHVPKLVHQSTRTQTRIRGKHNHPT